MFATKIRNGLILRKTGFLKHSSRSIATKEIFKHKKIPLKPILLIGTPALGVSLVAGTFHYYVRKLGLSYFPKRTLNARKATLNSRRINPPGYIKTSSTFLGLKFWLRFFQLGIIFTPLLFFFPFSLVSENCKNVWNILLLHTLEWGGPMFVKLGQWASTRSDLFSCEIRTTLSTLHSKVKHQNPKDTIKTIKKALNITNINEYFKTFDNKPIGAGVMAEVYKATLLNDKTVAVKVRRKAVKDLIDADLLLLNTFTNFLLVWLPKTLQPFSIKNAVTQFSEFMTSQIDLNNEFENLKQFHDNFEKVKNIKFPVPIYASNDGTVLVESLEIGETLSNLFEDSKVNKDSLLNENKCKKFIGKLGLHVFLKMALIDNFCHSDLHPGNLIVQFKKIKPYQYEVQNLVVIDAGLVTQLTQKDQHNFIDLFAAVATGQGEEAGKLMIERTDPELLDSTPEEQIKFIKGIKEVISEVSAVSFTLEKVRFGDVLQKVLNLVYSYKIPIDPNFSTLVLSLVVAEGVLRQLDGNLDIFGQSMPYILLSNREYKKVVLEKATSVLYTNVDSFYSSVYI